MEQTVFVEMDFVLLVIFSVVIPLGIYAFLYKKFAISRWTVVGFAVLLVGVAGIDLVLLQLLSARVKVTESLTDDRIFSGELSLALYLFPAVFAGLGVNLLSSVLVNHLNEAEKEFEKEYERSDRYDAPSAPHWLRGVGNSGALSEVFVLIGSTVGVAAIFLLDVLSGPEIRLNVLYVFPVAIVARYCTKLRIAAAALAVTTILQIVTFANDAIAIPSFVTDVCVAIAASLMVIFLARTSRNRYLLAVNQAETDPLTSLANRRRFISAVDSEIARQTRYGGIFALAVLDLDGFKKLNDSKGHLAGDEALKLTAEILRTYTRESDLVGRIGGDEFAVLLPNTQDVDCSLMFRNLCSTIAARMADAGFDVTASMGCRTFKVPPENTAVALQQADVVMYEAKNRGKNRVVHT